MLTCHLTYTDNGVQLLTMVYNYEKLDFLFNDYVYFWVFSFSKNDLNDRLSQYPSVDSFNNYVTWTALEEALKGVREELEPKERIVIEMHTQTVGHAL